MGKIFESHAHYEDARFDEDRDELLAHLFKNEIAYIVNVGSSMETSRRSLELAGRYEGIYAAIGVHPEEAAELDEEKLGRLKEKASRAKENKIVAIGEIGLDYYWPEPSREIQKKWFERQLQLAREVKLPVIIHSREAAKDTLDRMKAFHGEEIGGVIHCFSYSKEIAREYLNMGFYIGIGGVVTFPNGRKLVEVAEYVPLDRILLETDCPYLSPVPKRGKRNSSENLVYVAEKLAQIKGISTEEVIEATYQNAVEMYRI